MYSDDEMKAAAREAYAATDLDQPGSVILRVTNRLRDAMPLDGEPLALAICLSWAYWAIEDAQPSPLAVALAGAFTAGELRRIRADFGNCLTVEEGDPLDRLEDALAEAIELKVS